MDEKNELMNYLCGSEDNALVSAAVDEFLFLGEKLKELKKLPFYETKQGQPHKQRALPAAKLYKEMLQQYTNVLKVLQSYDRSSDNAEESPLRQWVKQHVNSE